MDFLTYMTRKVLKSPKSKKSSTDLFSLQSYDFLMKKFYGNSHIIFNGGFGHFIYLLSGNSVRSHMAAILLRCKQSHVSDSRCSKPRSSLWKLPLTFNSGWIRGLIPSKTRFFRYFGLFRAFLTFSDPKGGVKWKLRNFFIGTTSELTYSDSCREDLILTWNRRPSDFVRATR